MQLFTQPVIALQQIEHLVRYAWDLPRPFGTSKVYVLEHTDPHKMRNIIREVLGVSSGSGSTKRVRSGGDDTVTTGVSGVYRFEAFADKNALVAICKTEQAFDFLDDLIAKLDQPSTIGLPVKVSLRHADGDMYPASEDQYRSFLLSPWSQSVFVTLYEGDRLLSVAVTDKQPRGLSAIYTFFEPNEDKRSLGTLSILKQIELCQLWGLDYLYLGYWIKDCDKMNYKTQYRPTEMFVNDRWLRLK